MTYFELGQIYGTRVLFCNPSSHIKGEFVVLGPQELGFSSSFRHPLVENLTPKAIYVYQSLLEVAYTVSDRRGYKASPNQISFFCPAEIVACALNIGRTSLYRYLKELKTSGLVDQRGHMTSYNGATRCDGSLWAINLKPDTGFKAKLHIEDFKQNYRDLAADIDDGRTAYALLQKMEQSNIEEEKSVTSELILNWITLPPLIPNSDSSMTVPSADGLEKVLDLPHVSKPDRSDVVADTAELCALELADSSNIQFYYWLMWQALRLHACQEDYFFAIYQNIIRVKIDMAEGYAKKPGALFVSRLKQLGIWDRLREAPPWRVGQVPPGNRVKPSERDTFNA